MSILHPFKGKNKDQKQAPNTNFTNPISQIFLPEQGRNIINDSEKLINAWLSPNNIPMKTSLDQNQINSICVLKSLADQFKIKPLQDLVNNFIMFMLSKNSESAKQLVAILGNQGLLSEQETDLITKFSR